MIVEDVRQVISNLVTPEARAAATLVLVVAALVTAIVLAPRVVWTVHRVLKNRILSNERVPVETESFNLELPIKIFIWTLQLAVFIGIGLATLAIWGFSGLASEAVLQLSELLPLLVKGLFTVALVGGTLVGIDLLETRLEVFAEDSDRLNQHQQGIVFRVLQLTVFIAAGLASLTVWGVNLGGLLVGAGFLGIVIGTAARTTIGSLIAGFVLMFSRPFEIGDWVEIGDDEGIVADITIISTRIRNPRGEEVVIPNERVANATVTNRTTLGQLRLSVDVGVDYDADVERAEAVVEETLKGISHALDNPAPQVVPKALGDSAVVLECRFWIDHPSAARRALAKAAVVREVKAALDEAGIKIPYPQRELLGREEAGGFEVARQRADLLESETPPTDD
jgi:small-conductance mechanosensitive channel